MKKFKQVALRAVKLAGQRILKYYDDLKSSDIHEKERHEPVTKADLEANKIIIKTIKQAFPDHDLLSEETGEENNPGKYQWVIDPLDGTSNYTIKNPLFCTALALVKDQEILLSVIYAPFIKELYYAEKGQGTFLNGKKIKVSAVDDLNESIILIGKSHSSGSKEAFINYQRKLLGKVLNYKPLGSGSLDLAFVAAGRVAGCVLLPPEIPLWDTLPGTLMVREAGGVVTDFKGRVNDFGRQGLVVANKLIYKQLLDLVK